MAKDVIEWVGGENDYSCAVGSHEIRVKQGQAGWDVLLDGSVVTGDPTPKGAHQRAELLYEAIRPHYSPRQIRCKVCHRVIGLNVQGKVSWHFREGEVWNAAKRSVCPGTGAQP